MEMIKVGICLDDVRFAEALSRGLARECRNMSFILLPSVEEGLNCDLILAEQDDTDPRVVTMTRDKSAENVYEKPPHRVYRYKESDSLINDLLFIYFKMTGKNLEFIGETKCKLLIFTAASGGSGSTAVSISVGQMLYKLYDCRCLYLNLCPIDDSKKYLAAEGENSLLKLLYYLDTKKNFPLESFITHSVDIDYINTNLMNSYFDGLKSNLLFQLLKKIDLLGKYAFVILDMSNHLSRTNRNLLRYASRVVFLRNQQMHMPEAYFQSISREIEERMEKGILIPVDNFVEDFWCQENHLSISWEKHGIVENGEGLLDLSRIRPFVTETAALARKIMEEGDGDNFG